MSRPESVTPWVEHVRRIETTTERATSWTDPPAPGTIWEVIATFDTAIRGLGQLLADACPLPVPASTAEQAVTSAAEAVIRATFEGDDVPPEATEIALAAQRIEATEAEGEITVPLSIAGPAAGNWLVLVRVVSDRLEAAATDVERMAGRVELRDRSDAAAALEDVVGALRDTSTTFRNVLTRALWHNPPDGLVDAEYHRVREYVTETIETYNPYV